jgi:hypothetical protein
MVVKKWYKEQYRFYIPQDLDGIDFRNKISLLRTKDLIVRKIEILLYNYRNICNFPLLVYVWIINNHRALKLMLIVN